MNSEQMCPKHVDENMPKVVFVGSTHACLMCSASPVPVTVTVTVKVTVSVTYLKLFKKKIPHTGDKESLDRCG